MFLDILPFVSLILLPVHPLTFINYEMADDFIYYNHLLCHIEQLQQMWKPSKVSGNHGT